MKNKQIKEMMRDIDPQYQQKADERAAAVQAAAGNRPHRSLIPSLLVGGAAIGCAAFAAAVILPQLHTAEIDTANSQEEMQTDVQESALDSELAEVVAAEMPITDFSNDAVRLMAPAYAPYVLDISAAQQQALADALTASEWIPYDMDKPFGDGEAYFVFVYNSGDSYSLTSYADHTAVLARNGEKTRWKISEAAERAIAEAANPSGEELEGHLTWCVLDSINEKDIWKNTRVGAKVCDMTNKQDVFFKMNNTADYFDRCSGVIRIGRGTEMTRYDFQVDLNTARAYQLQEEFAGAGFEEMINGSAPLGDSYFTVIDAMDAENVYSVDDSKNYYSLPNNIHRIDSPTVSFDALYCENPECDNYDSWNSRTQLLHGISIYCIENYRMVIDYLHDFDKWEIAGEDQVNGRLCVQLEGTIDIGYEEAKRFVWFVDEETGVTVRMLMFDANDQVIQMIDVIDLAFNEDAAPVQTIDFTGLTERAMLQPMPAWDEEQTEEGPVTEAAAPEQSME